MLNTRNICRLMCALSMFMLAQGATAATARIVPAWTEAGNYNNQPLNGSNATALIAAIDNANADPRDNIIDLGGHTWVIFQDCRSAGDPNCAAATVGPPATPNLQPNGFDGLPPILNAATTGTLSIINGRIVRAAFYDPDTSPPLDAKDPTPNPSLFRLLEVNPGADLTLFNVTLENGSTSLNADGAAASNLCGVFTPVLPLLPFYETNNVGGAIYNAGTLNLQNAALLHNLANDLGGAIFNAAGGVIDIQSTNFSSNKALACSANFPQPTPNFGSNGGGGAIFNSAANFPVVTAPATPAADLNSIDNSSFDNNQTSGNGGAINNQGIADNIYANTFSRNLACDAIEGAGQCAEGVASGAGGAIYNDDNGPGTNGSTLLWIANSTFSGNQAYQGGAIYNISTNAPLPLNVMLLPPPHPVNGVWIYNSTIARNKAWEGGGGIYNHAGSIINALISDIVADNVDTNENNIACPDIYNDLNSNLPIGGDGIISHSYNLIGNAGQNDDNIDGTCLGDDFFSGDGFLDIVGTYLDPINPKLGHLTWNGGFTETMALLPGSPAINNGLNPLELEWDQRGKKFRRVVGSLTDIGAYELQNDFSAAGAM